MAWCSVSSAVQAAPLMVDEITTISVIADSSLALPMTQIIKDYSTQKKQAVVASYVAVNQQEQAVADGVGYDVLITARPKLLTILKQQGLVDIYTEATIAKNRLAMVAAKDSDFDASLATGFPLADIILRFAWLPGLVVGNPETLREGTIAREALRYYGVLEDLEAYTLYEKDLSEIINMVANQGRIALIYHSDAKRYESLKVVDIVPEAAHHPVAYVAVVLAGNRMEPAREFVEFLQQPQAKKTLTAHGFDLPQ